MAILHPLVTRGFSTGLNDGDAFFVVTRGYGVGVPVPVAEPAGGGRRIYDPDDKHKNKTRKLTKREFRELDRMFRANAQPAYVAPPEPVVQVRKRTEPLPVPGFTPVVAADRVQAAKQFMALDAIDAFLESLERDAPAKELKRLHVKAQQHAQFLAREQERLAQEFAMRVAAEQLAELQRMEAQRIADEDEMLMILAAVLQ